MFTRVINCWPCSYLAIYPRIMSEGDNCLRRKDNEGDVYTVIRRFLMFVLPLMALQLPTIRQGRKVLFFPQISGFVRTVGSHWPLAHNPGSQYVAHSCLCLKTVQLINCRVSACNKNHDGRWTMHLLLLNFSNDTGSSLGLQPVGTV